jgi:hypothetical protein
MLFFYLGEIRDCKSIASETIANKDFDVNSIQSFSSDDNDFLLLNNKEIQCNGILYDIVKTEKHGGMTTYYAINDSKETEIINRISELANNNSNHPANPVKANAPDVLKYIGQDKIADYTNIYNEAITDNVIAYIAAFYNSPLGDIDSPPPQDFIA